MLDIFILFGMRSRTSITVYIKALSLLKQLIFFISKNRFLFWYQKYYLIQRIFIRLNFLLHKNLIFMYYTGSSILIVLCQRDLFYNVWLSPVFFVCFRWLGKCVLLWSVLWAARLLNSPRLVVLGLSMGYETWPPMHWHRPFVIGWSKYRLGLPQSQWIVGLRDW